MKTSANSPKILRIIQIIANYEKYQNKELNEGRCDENGGRERELVVSDDDVERVEKGDERESDGEEDLGDLEGREADKGQVGRPFGADKGQPAQKRYQEPAGRHQTQHSVLEAIGKVRLLSMP